MPKKGSDWAMLGRRTAAGRKGKEYDDSYFVHFSTQKRDSQQLKSQALKSSNQNQIDLSSTSVQTEAISEYSEHAVDTLVGFLGYDDNTISQSFSL